MPLPIVIGVAAAVASIAGAGACAHGGVSIKKAKDKENEAKALHEECCNKFVEKGTLADETMDDLGILELETLGSFEEFSNVAAKIQNKPESAAIDTSCTELPEFNSDGLRAVSVMAKATIGGLAGAAAGTAGGFAAAGATTSVVAALGTASTGTAISTLSGAAATNATLAALGGGSLAMGGGGMAAGAAVLGGAAAGAGILVGGVIVNVIGRKLSDNAEELMEQVLEEKESVDQACALFDDIRENAERYAKAIEATQHEYAKHVEEISFVVNSLGKTDWNDFTEKEKLSFESTVLLVGLLFNMCKTNIVIDDDGDGITDRVNHDGINKGIKESSRLIETL